MKLTSFYSACALVLLLSVQTVNAQEQAPAAPEAPVKPEPGYFPFPNNNSNNANGNVGLPKNLFPNANDYTPPTGADSAYVPPVAPINQVTPEQLWASQMCGGNAAYEKNQKNFEKCEKKYSNPKAMKREQKRGEKALAKILKSCGGDAAEKADEDKFAECMMKKLDERQAKEDKRNGIDPKTGASTDTAADTKADNDCSVSSTGATATCSGVLYLKDPGLVVVSPQAAKTGANVNDAAATGTSIAPEDKSAQKPASVAK